MQSFIHSFIVCLPCTCTPCSPHVQYPGRLCASAWHLLPPPASPRTAVGFSGTKDNARLLPLAVQQAEPEEEGAVELRATDGLMLARLLATTHPYVGIQPQVGLDHTLSTLRGSQCPQASQLGRCSANLPECDCKVEKTYAPVVYIWRASLCLCVAVCSNN